MKRVVSVILLMGMFLMVACSNQGVKEVIDNEINEIIEDEPLVVEVTEYVIPEDIVEEIIEEEPINSDEILVDYKGETFRVIGGGYFYSEPFTEIYPSITEDDGGLCIEIRNSEADKHIIVAVETELDDYTIIEENENTIIFEVIDRRIDITDETMENLYANIVFYLYEIV